MSTTPVALTDEILAALIAYSEPLAPCDRHDFVKRVAAELKDANPKPEVVRDVVARVQFEFTSRAVGPCSRPRSNGLRLYRGMSPAERVTGQDCWTERDGRRRVL